MNNYLGLQFSDYPCFGEWLSAMMGKYDISAKTEINKRTIYRWLNNECVPDYYGIINLLEVFGLNITIS